LQMRQHSRKRLKGAEAFEAGSPSVRSEGGGYGEGNIFADLLGSPEPPDLEKLKAREAELKKRLEEELALLRQKRQEEQERYRENQTELMSREAQKTKDRDKAPSVRGRISRRLRQITNKAETGRGAKN